MTQAHGPERDDQLAQLLKLAGRRPSPDASRIAQARAAARAELQRTRRVRGRRRWVFGATAALAIGLLGSAAWLSMRGATPAIDRPEVATVQRVVGRLRISDALDRRVDAGGTDLPRRLRAGDRVEVSPDSLAAFELADGTSVRLAGDTLAVFASRQQIELIRGVLYVDADPARRTGAVTVATPLGAVTHVGTQFELQLRRDSLRVRVREGSVAVESRQGRLTSAAGEALLLTPDRPAERHAIATSGPEWSWVAAMAQPFTLEGATVAAFLQWASREQGWRWEYADDASRRAAERAVLHGSIDGLTPADAVAAVLPAAGLAFTRHGDRLIVRAAKTPGFQDSRIPGLRFRDWGLRD